MRKFFSIIMLVAVATVNAPALMMSDSDPMPFTPVDHHQFSDNMNVVARVMKGDVELSDLCLAAFIDDECRGATYATDDGLYLLTIAGNADETGKSVRFATMIDGEIVWLCEQLTWISDWIYGDLDEPQILTIDVVIKGDVNGDGRVNVSDVAALINMILGIVPMNQSAADVNGDGRVNVSDVSALINIIMGIS